MSDSAVSQQTLSVLLFAIYTAAGACAVLQIPLLQSVLPLVALALLGCLLLVALGLQGTPVQTLLVGTGLSIVIVMLGSVSLDTALSQITERPLTTPNLAIALTLSGYGLCFAVRNTAPENVSVPHPTPDDLKVTVCSASLFLSIVTGAMILNDTGVYWVIIGTIIGFGALFAIAVRNAVGITDWGYRAALLLFAAGVFLPVPLRSPYLFGGDVLRSYWLFKYIDASSDWSIVTHDIAMLPLSTTLFPAVVNRLTGLDPIFIFKFIVPGAAVLIPLVVYEVTSQRMSSARSFLAGMFITVTPLFSSATTHPRTVVAIFCLAVFILSISMWGMENPSARLIYLFFGAGITVAHYTTGMITLIILAISVILLFVDGKLSTETPPQDYISITSLHLSIVSLFTYLWFLFTFPEMLTSPVTILFQALGGGESDGGSVRGEGVVSLFSLQPWQMPPPDAAYWTISWIVLGLIGVGGSILAIGWLRSQLPSSKTHFHQRREMGFTIIGGGLLMGFTVVPVVSTAYGLARTFLTVSLFVAPIFVFGAAKVGSFPNIQTGKWKQLTVLLLLFFLLANTFTVHNMAGDSKHGLFTSSDGDSLKWNTMSEGEMASAGYIERFGNGRQFYSERHDARAVTTFDPPPNYQHRTRYVRELNPGVYPTGNEYILLTKPNLQSGVMAVSEANYRPFNYDRYQQEYGKIYANPGGEVLVDTEEG